MKNKLIHQLAAVNNIRDRYNDYANTQYYCTCMKTSSSYRTLKEHIKKENKDDN